MAGGGRLNFEKQAWAHVTPKLMWILLLYSLGSLYDGYDTSNWGTLSVLPSFTAAFGTCDKTGVCSIPTDQKGIMTSVVFATKWIGALAASPGIERFGFPKMMAVTCVTQLIGVIIESAAGTSWVVFTIGRLFVYLSVGFVQVIISLYLSELVPASIRGFATAILSLCVPTAGLASQVVNRAVADVTQPYGWIVPVAIQAIPTLIIFPCCFWLPHSPRWLIVRGRRDEAIKVLDQIRPPQDAMEGRNELEVEAIESAWNESIRLKAQTGWLDLFRGTNLRRTLLCAYPFWFQQFAGGQFVTSYAPQLYQTLGLGTLTFTFSCVQQACVIVACTFGMLTMDIIGRRPFICVGTFFQALFLMMVAVIGLRNPVTPDDGKIIFAMICLYKICAQPSLTMLSFVNGSEVSRSSLRSKTLAFGISVDVIAAIIEAEITPYMLNAWGPKVGFFFGGLCLVCCGISIVLFPELKGRSLEEMDELFEAQPPLWAWQFKKYQTTGIGAYVRELEGSGKVKDVENLMHHQGDQARDVDAKATVEQLEDAGLAGAVELREVERD